MLQRRKKIRKNQLTWISCCRWRNCYLWRKTLWNFQDFMMFLITSTSELEVSSEAKCFLAELYPRSQQKMSAFLCFFMIYIKFSCFHSVTSQPQNYFMAYNQYTSKTVIVNWCIIKRLSEKPRIYNFAAFINFSSFLFPSTKKQIHKNHREMSAQNSE